MMTKDEQDAVARVREALTLAKQRMLSDWSVTEIADLRTILDALSARFDEGDVERVARALEAEGRVTFGFDGDDATMLARAALAALQSKDDK